MTPGLWILLAAVALALALGGHRALTDGRFRGARRVAASAPATTSGGEVPTRGHDERPADTAWAHVVAAVPDARRGEQATLVQFSSAFCAPCRATRRTLAEVAGIVPGVVHLEIDAEQHLDLVRRVDVLRTPTTLVLDAQGREVARASGAPRKEQVVAAVATAAEG